MVVQVKKAKIIVREFDEKKDSNAVEKVEERCEVGPTGKLSLFTHLLGDPICRIRHSPAFLMLIVGILRGCIKTVTCGKKLPRNGNNGHDPAKKIVPVYTKLAYILGLRVSPSHRRMGIGFNLVRRMEKWFEANGADYSYMATENDNVASVSLFTEKCGYSKFRTPSILVQPVFAHRVRVSPAVKVVKLTASDAEALYRWHFSTTEFFPRDIGAVVSNSLTLGTFLALPRDHAPAEWQGIDVFLSDPPESWAVASVWNSKDVWRLEVRGASRITRGLAKTTRLLDRALPWLKIPSVPEVFRPFGFHFLYGVGGGGPLAEKLMKALCRVAHNIAKEKGCAVVATEIAGGDPLRLAIPHWKKLSCAEDLWCIKRLGEEYSDGSVGDWTKSPPENSIFVDPREF
ncbi:hypothetical protein V2J09_009841 [Rumex salicifolius]